MEKQIQLHAFWLIKVRWIIVSITIIIITIAYIFKIFDINYVEMLSVTIILLILNVFYHKNLKKITQAANNGINNKFVGNIYFQIALDFIALTVLLHFSGSIENPCIIFYIFHMIIAGIILPPKHAYRQALFAILLFTTLVSLEYLNIIPHHSLNSDISIIYSDNLLYLLFALAVFIITSLVLVYFTVTIAQRLRNVQIELKKKNDLLLNQDKIKNEYVSRVTHNIKGDLSTISSCLAAANQQKGKDCNNTETNFVNKAYDRTKKLMLFVEDLLILTKMRLQNRFELQEFDLRELCNELVERIKPFTEEKEIHLEHIIPDSALIIMGLKISIEEALFNILHNAVKYTPKKGNVKFHVNKNLGKVIIKIKDNGYGISNDDLPHIFDEFYRAEKTNTIEGTGLGLALAKTVIERHKGKISVVSELNKGTEFTVSFYLKLSAINQSG